MKYLNNIWIRVVVSLVGGGVVSELIHITTGDPNRPRGASLTLVYALILFGILTLIVRRHQKRS